MPSVWIDVGIANGESELKRFDLEFGCKLNIPKTFGAEGVRLFKMVEVDLGGTSKLTPNECYVLHKDLEPIRDSMEKLERTERQRQLTADKEGSRTVLKKMSLDIQLADREREEKEKDEERQRERQRQREREEREQEDRKKEMAKRERAGSTPTATSTPALPPSPSPKTTSRSSTPKTSPSVKTPTAKTPTSKTPKARTKMKKPSLKRPNGTGKYGTVSYSPKALQKDSPKSPRTNIDGDDLDDDTITIKGPPGEALETALANLKSNDWKDQVEGLTTIRGLARQHPSTLSSEVNFVIQTASNLAKSLRSSIVKAAIQCLRTLADTHPDELSNSISLFVTTVTKRSADANQFMQQLATTTMTQVVQNLDRGVVVMTVLPLLKDKSSQVQSQAIYWIDMALQDMFKTGFLADEDQTNMVIDCMKELAARVDDKNEQVRGAAKGCCNTICQAAVDFGRSSRLKKLLVKNKFDLKSREKWDVLLAQGTQPQAQEQIQAEPAVSLNSTPKGGSESKSRFMAGDDSVQYIPNVELKVDGDPATVMANALSVIEKAKAEWRETFDAIDAVRALVLHEPHVVKDKLGPLARYLPQQVTHIRSAIAKTALMCVEVLFVHLPPTAMSSYFVNFLPAVLRRTVDQNEFLANSAQDTITSIVTAHSTSPTRLLKFLLKDLKDKGYSSAIKAQIATTVHRTVENVKGSSLFNNQEIVIELVSYLGPMLYERNETSRKQARATTADMAAKAVQTKNESALKETVRKYADHKYKDRLEKEIAKVIADADVSTSIDSLNSIAFKRRPRSRSDVSEESVASTSSMANQSNNRHSVDLDDDSDDEFFFLENDRLEAYPHFANDSSSILDKAFDILNGKQPSANSVMFALQDIRGLAVHSAAILKSRIGEAAKSMENYSKNSRAQVRKSAFACMQACFQSLKGLDRYVSSLLPCAVTGSADGKSEVSTIAGMTAETIIAQCSTSKSIKVLCEIFGKNSTSSKVRVQVAQYLCPALEKIDKDILQDFSLLEEVVAVLGQALYDQSQSARNHARSTATALCTCAMKHGQLKDLKTILVRNVEYQYQDRLRTIILQLDPTLDDDNDSVTSTQSAHSNTSDSEHKPRRKKLSIRVKSRSSSRSSVPATSTTDLAVHLQDEELKLDGDPKSVAETTFKRLDSESNDDAVAALLTTIRAIAVNQPSHLKSRMSGGVRRIIELMAPPSTTSAMHIQCLICLTTLFKCVSSLMEPVLANLIPCLLKRACNLVANVKTAAEHALTAMVMNCHSSRVLKYLLQKQHLSKVAYQKPIAQNFLLCVEKMGSDLLDDDKNLVVVINAVAPLLYVKDLETRKAAKQIGTVLVSQAEQAGSGCEKLESIIEQSVDQKVKGRLLELVKNDDMHSQRTRARNRPRAYSVPSKKKDQKAQTQAPSPIRANSGEEEMVLSDGPVSEDDLF